MLDGTTMSNGHSSTYSQAAARPCGRGEKARDRRRPKADVTGGLHCATALRRSLIRRQQLIYNAQSVYASPRMLPGDAPSRGSVWLQCERFRPSLPSIAHLNRLSEPHLVGNHESALVPQHRQHASPLKGHQRFLNQLVFEHQGRGRLHGSRRAGVGHVCALLTRLALHRRLALCSYTDSPLQVGLFRAACGCGQRHHPQAHACK